MYCKTIGPKNLDSYQPQKSGILEDKKRPKPMVSVMGRAIGQQRFHDQIPTVEIDQQTEHPL